MKIKILILLIISTLVISASAWELKKDSPNTQNSVREIYLNASILTLDVGNVYVFKTTIIPSNAQDKRLTWTTSNSKVITISSSGSARAIASGNASIKVRSSNGKEDSCNITVDNRNDNYNNGNNSNYDNHGNNGSNGYYDNNGNNNYVSLNRTSLSLSPKSSYTLIATVPYGSSKNLKWRSSNPSIASVSNNGKINAKKTGNATITVSTKDGRSDSCYVKVGKNTSKYNNNYNNNYNNMQIVLNRTNLTLDPGETFTLTAALKDSPYRVIGNNIWSSNNSRIATIDNRGKITARSPGNTSVTVRTNNSSATCYVKVTNNGYYDNNNNNNYDNNNGNYDNGRYNDGNYNDGRYNDKKINRNDNNNNKRGNGKDIKNGNKNIKKEHKRQIEKDDKKDTRENNKNKD